MNQENVDTSIARFLQRKQQEHGWLQGPKEEVVKTVLISLEDDTNLEHAGTLHDQEFPTIYNPRYA